MCFIAAGMGGGTGTGAAPVIAKAARDKGILTVGVVTKPFAFEGNRRARSADAGIDELQQHVDTLIVIPNQNLFRIANPNTTFKEAFQMADEVLQQGVRGITDLMVMPGLINLDFADVRSVMGEMGKAMMGTGEAEGDNRAIEAAEQAIANPLLDGVSMKGAKGVIISITGGEDMRLMEVDEAANHIKELVDPDANIIWGSAFNNNLEGKIRVSVVATGIDADAVAQPAAPAKVFAFPGNGRGAAEAAKPQAVSTPAPIKVPTAAPVQAAPVQAAAPQPASKPVEIAEAPMPTLKPVVARMVEGPAATISFEDEDQGGDELLLDTGDMMSAEQPAAANGTRSWIAAEEEPAQQPAPKREGGTLFERMSNIARGAAKAQVDEEPSAARGNGRDSLDIPRFLNRQNNQ
jgi:cell division protein FtsZ